MAHLPRTECPECDRDVAVSRKGLRWRHDGRERDPELRSCPGSLKPVAPPEGQAVLFVDPRDLEDTAPEDDFVMPEPRRLF